MKKTDAAEIDSFYYQYYEHYVRELDQGEKAERYYKNFTSQFSFHNWKCEFRMVPLPVRIITELTSELTELSSSKPTRQQECFLKCSVLLIRLRKLKKLLLRY